MVEHHQIRAELFDLGVNLVGLAATDVQTGIGPLAGAGDHREHVGAGGTRQRLELT
jgi:hypothetical protein